MEKDRMSEISSFQPYEESELSDLDLEFVPCGIFSSEECTLSQDKNQTSTHVTQASISECYEHDCGVSKKLEISGQESIDDEQGKSSLLTTRINQELKASEPIENQINEKVSCSIVDSNDEHNGNKSLCHKHIPNGKYCLFNHTLYFFNRGNIIKLEFDVDEELFSCPFCNVIALDNNSIGEHIWNHTGDEHLKCLLGCHAIFLSFEEMVNHLSSHTNNNGYRCGVCHGSFPTLALIKSHVSLLHQPTRHLNKTHEYKSVTNFLCVKCGVRFDEEKSLNLHNLEECNSRYFSCSFCELGFQSDLQLKKHSASHYNQFPYRCRLCTFAIDNRCDMHFHLNQHRRSETPLACPSCTLMCPNEETFMAHVLELHCDGTLKCVCCNREDFKGGSELMSHMRSHEAHGWTESRVPGIKVYPYLQILAAERQGGNKNNTVDDDILTVTDCVGVKLQFEREHYLSGEEQDLQSFEMDIL